MKIEKWVDFGTEVTVDIDVADIRGALVEAFERTEKKLDEEPNVQDILRALNQIGTFLRAFDDETLKRLTTQQRLMVAKYLADTAERWYKSVSEETTNARE